MLLLIFSLIFAISITMCYDVVLFGLILFETLWFLDSGVHFLSQVREVFSYYVFRYVICGTSWVALVVTNPPANARDTGSIPGSGSSPGEGNGNILQYSCLENPMDRRAWQATVPEVTKSRTKLSKHNQDLRHSESFSEGKHIWNLQVREKQSWTPDASLEMDIK